MVFSISAAELFASGEAGGSPVAPTVADVKERLLSVDVTIHRAADHGSSSRQVLQDLMIEDIDA